MSPKKSIAKSGLQRGWPTQVLDSWRIDLLPPKSRNPRYFNMRCVQHSHHHHHQFLNLHGIINPGPMDQTFLLVSLACRDALQVSLAPKYCTWSWKIGAAYSPNLKYHVELAVQTERADRPAEPKETRSALNMHRRSELAIYQVRRRVLQLLST